MTGAGLWLAVAFSLTMPFADEWGVLGQMAGEEPVTPGWLWSQHNEHRLPLPRLIYLGLGWMTGFDLRAGAVFSAVALSGLSAGLMLAARSLRGRSEWADAYFPLTVQHWGSITNLVWGFQLCFVTASVLGGMCLVAAATCRERLTWRAAVGATLAAAGAALCGAYGAPYLAAVAGWFIVAAITGGYRRRPHRGADAWMLAGLAVLMLALLGAYFAGFSRPMHHTASPGLWASTVTAVEALATSFGPVGKEIWPLSGLLALGAGLGSAAQLVMVFWRRPEERVRAAGLAAMLWAVAALAGGIGLGRAAFGAGAGLADRYIIFMMPLGCIVYLQWELYCRPAVWRPLQRLLLAAAVGVALVAFYKGLGSAREWDAVGDSFRADLVSGMSSDDLALRHGDRLSFDGIEPFARRLEVLRRAGLCDYRDADPKGPGSRVRVRRIAELSRYDVPTAVVRLAGGEELRQPFRLDPGSELSRLDIHINHRRPGRTADRLDWKLEVVDGAGELRPLGGGTIDSRALDVYDYVTLELPGYRLSPSGRGVLTLSVPAGGAAGRTIDVPVYAGTPAARTTAAGVAAEPGCVKAFVVLVPRESGEAENAAGPTGTRLAVVAPDGGPAAATRPLHMAGGESR